MDTTLPSPIIGVVGFGRIGGSFARRLKQAGRHVMIFDLSRAAREEAERADIAVTENLHDLGQQASIIFILVPAGDAVDAVITPLAASVAQDTVIIDAGNSHFNDSVRRYTMLKAQGIAFLDCGTSGGVHGLKDGFCLMVGGDQEIYDNAVDVFEDLAYPQGSAYVGPAGAGHFVKMIHNGIEYGLLQAYAEGFHVLKEGCYKDLDLAQIAHLWNHGAVIRSFILGLVAHIFDEVKDFDAISGKVAYSGMGQWTVDEAHEHHIPVKLIEDALNIRKESQKTGGDFATKLVALLRYQFGGHKAEGCKICKV